MIIYLYSLFWLVFISKYISVFQNTSSTTNNNENNIRNHNDNEILMTNDAMVIVPEEVAVNTQDNTTNDVNFNLNLTAIDAEVVLYFLFLLCYTFS